MVHCSGLVKSQYRCRSEPCWLPVPICVLTLRLGAAKVFTWMPTGTVRAEPKLTWVTCRSYHVGAACPPVIGSLECRGCRSRGSGPGSSWSGRCC